MKRLILFVCVINIKVLIFSQSCLGITDNFETGTVGPQWATVGGGYTWIATTASPAEGLYCLSQTGSGSHMNGLRWDFTPFQPSYVSWWGKTTSASITDGYFVLGDANSPSNFGILFCYFSSAGYLRFYASSVSVYEHPISSNTWYHVEIKDIDFVNKHFDIYIDDFLVATDFPFRSTASVDMSQLNLYNLTTSTTSYYDDIIIGNSPPSIDSAYITNNICYGDNIGMIDLTTSGASGNGPLSYSWNTSDTTEDLSGLAGGTYTITITDSIGCATVDSFYVFEPGSTINTALLSTDVLCNGDTTGTVDLTVSGGVPGAGYTYSWDNGATTEDLTDLGGGTFIVTVTDSLGCTHMDTVTINEPSAIISASSVTNDNGTGNGAIDLTVTGGTPTYTYWWNDSSTTEDITSLNAGTYIVTITDSAGCTAMDTIVVYSTAGNNNELSEAFKIWPNPFVDLLNIQIITPLDTDSKISLSDLSGKMIIQQNIAKGTSLVNLKVEEGLPSGIYLLQINQGAQQFVTKIIKR